MSDRRATPRAGRRRAGTLPSGTNAPKSAGTAVDADVSCPLQRAATARKRFDDGVGAGHEAEAFLDVPDRRLGAEIRRRGGAAIVDQDAAVAEEVRVGQRMQHALIGVDAGEQDRLGAEIAQDASRAACPRSR